MRISVWSCLTIILRTISTRAKLYDNTGNPVVIVPGNATYKYQQSAARLFGAEVSVNLHPRSIAWLTMNNSIAYTQGRNRNMELISTHGDEARYLPFIPPTHIRSELKATTSAIMGYSPKPMPVEADIITDQPHFYRVDDTETFTPGYTLFQHRRRYGSILNKRGKTVLNYSLQLDNVQPA